MKQTYLLSAEKDMWKQHFLIFALGLTEGIVWKFLFPETLKRAFVAWAPTEQRSSS